MNDTTNAAKNTTVADALNADIERIAGDLLGVGRAWAAHGLQVGRSALQVSAHSLGVTARLLDDLARRFTDPSRPVVVDASADGEPAKDDSTAG